MRILDIPGQVAESALSIVGIRTGTEEPHYLSTTLTDVVELRRYGSRIAAETVVDADEERARNIGFRRLAGYIFGANHRDEKIAMTAPVAQSGERIAMTAPVAQVRDADNRWTIRFFMPSKWTMDTLPTPDDEDVTLVEVPAQTYAVLRFSGDRGPNAVAARTRELLAALRAHDIEADGEPTAWFFDPPWTLPFRRRNEIAVPIRR
ncbi:SOUL family heme-binding protein [Mycobacterium sp. IDR2000157661]|uniref:SOUL family heme-binding protein n=1 Tax=Mycobacterium sp. IDR2000157661 TaxID=2867005 RepID=UPI001EEC2D98|nr:heme-binding protein [Mycobacterium sp. IDR2000157661]ULE34130.1 heme-binding protein [Mycobacterium sp. IDR2000157661]